MSRGVSCSASAGARASASSDANASARRSLSSIKVRDAPGMDPKAVSNRAAVVAMPGIEDSEDAPGSLNMLRIKSSINDSAWSPFVPLNDSAMLVPLSAVAAIARPALRAFACRNNGRAGPDHDVRSRLVGSCVRREGLLLAAVRSGLRWATGAVSLPLPRERGEQERVLHEAPAPAPVPAAAHQRGEQERVLHYRPAILLAAAHERREQFFFGCLAYRAALRGRCHESSFSGSATRAESQPGQPGCRCPQRFS